MTRMKNKREKMKAQIRNLTKIIKRKNECENMKSHQNEPKEKSENENMKSHLKELKEKSESENKKSHLNESKEKVKVRNLIRMN